MISKTAHILVVEDEPHIALGIVENLELEGYTAELARDGRAGLDAMLERRHDLVLLDVMLPIMDGFDVCRLARVEGVRTPIMFLTARGAVDDRVAGLQAGGDDYLPKPFHLDELLTRVQAILRRQAWAQRAPLARVLRFGANHVVLSTWAATSWDGAEHTLTEKEALLLDALAQTPGATLTREAALERVWGYDVFPSTRALETLVQRLRKRFERDPEHPEHLHTVRGVGYKLTLTPEPS